MLQDPEGACEGPSSPDGVAWNYPQLDLGPAKELSEAMHRSMEAEPPARVVKRQPSIFDDEEKLDFSKQLAEISGDPGEPMALGGQQSLPLPQSQTGQFEQISAPPPAVQPGIQAATVPGGKRRSYLPPKTPEMERGWLEASREFLERLKRRRLGQAENG